MYKALITLMTFIIAMVSYVFGKKRVEQRRRTQTRKTTSRGNGHQAPIVPPLQSQGPILFYDRDKPFYEFTNFSPYPITYNGAIYPTAEHLFQAHKFLTDRPDLAERIRNLSSARAVLQEATRLQRLRRHDWFEVNIDIMDSVLEAKFAQHEDLRRTLLETGSRELIEDSPIDVFWGIGEDGQGRNELGKCLMRVRDKLQSRRTEHRL